MKDYLLQLAALSIVALGVYALICFAQVQRFNEITGQHLTTTDAMLLRLSVVGMPK